MSTPARPVTAAAALLLVDLSRRVVGPRQTVDVGADVPVFTSPTPGPGLVLVATDEGVTASG